MRLTRYAIVDLDTGKVVNAVEYEEQPVGCPPGMEGNLVAVPHPDAGRGFSYANGVFTDNRKMPKLGEQDQSHDPNNL